MSERNEHEHSIRFITTDYEELFRIPDGGTVLVTFPDRQFTEKCSYIDDYHLKVGNSVYHICQYAEILKQNGGHCEPEPETELAKAAWQLGHREYLMLERTDAGFRYEILTKDFLSRTQGHLDRPEWSMNQAREFVLDLMGLDHRSRFAVSYKNLLRNHPSVYSKHDIIVEAEICKGHAINFINLAGAYCAANKNADNSRFNILSAFICFAAAIKTEQSVETVSIITPYAAQTRLVRAMVLDYRAHGETALRCSTVHQFQGSESDVIFFDAVESYPAKKPGWLMGKDFNSIKRLINVAVTRARGKLICVANGKFWNNNYEGTSHTLYRLLAYLIKHGKVVQQTDNKGLGMLVNNLSVKGGPEFFLDPETYIKTLEKDLS